MKKYIFKSIFLAIALFCGLIPSYATHIVGGDITYKHLGNNNYEITLTLRRDCNLGQVNFDSPASIGLFDFNTNVLIEEVRMPFVASDTVGNTIVANCGFIGSQVCVQRTSYRAVVTLPARPGGYIVAYQRCCRNASLNNVVTPLESGSTQWIHITEEALALQNSSPTFTSWPDVYICANIPLIYNHSAVDIDGDSLVYKTCIPFDGASIGAPQPTPPNNPPFQTINWNAPYDLNNMMGGTPLVINQNTGLITANPNLVGQFLIGICVEEYRNGQLISTVKRDFQYNVRICLPPVVAAFNTNFEPCKGKEVDFTNNTQNASTFVWNFNYPSTDTVFQSTSENPSFIYSQPGTYIVRLEAKTSTGACAGLAFDTIVIQEPPTDFLVGSGPVNTCGEVFNYTVTGGYTNGNITWSTDAGFNNIIGNGPTLSFNTSGAINTVLYVKSEIQGLNCDPIISSITINDRSFEVNFENQHDICIGLEKSINISTTSSSMPSFTFSDPRVISVTNNTIVVKTLATDIAPFTIIGNVSNEFGCSKEIVLNINPTNAQGSNFIANLESCENLRMCFTLENQSVSNVLWDFGLPGSDDTSTDNNPCYSYSLPGTYTVTLSSNNNVCPFTPVTQMITIPEKTTAPTVSSMLKDCSTNELCFTLSSGSVSGDITWNFGDPNSGANNTSSEKVPCHKFTAPGEYNVTLTNTNIACPFDQVEIKVTVPQKSIAPTLGTTLKDCNSNEYCFSSTGGAVLGNVTWNFGDPNSGANNTSSELAPCHKFTAPGDYIITLTNSNTDCPFAPVTIKVTVEPPFTLSPLQDLTVCQGLPFSLVSPPIPGVTYQWCNDKGELISNGPTLNISPTENSKYILKAKNSSGCTDSTSVNINVFKFNYNIESPAVICFGENFSIKAIVDNPSDYIFSWGPVECIVNGGSTPMPLVLAADKTITLTLTHKLTGCIDTKSINTKVESAIFPAFSGNFCNGQNATLSVILTNPDNYTYEWLPANMIISGGNTPNPVININSDKQFTVIITDKNTNCESLFNYTAVVNPLLNIVFDNPTVEINQGRDAELLIKNPIPGATYNWSTNQTGTSISVNPLSNTSYTVTVTDANGCTGTGVINVVVRTVNCTEKDEYLPNAFTPNNDNNNDILFVKSNVIDQLEFVIYNRWGQEMFNTTDINKGWDGTYDGKDLKPDVYAYYIKATCLNGDSFIKKGNVSLLR